MASARAVEEVAIAGKTRKKTSIFWSTVPENEQFRNVQVPGVVLDRCKDSKKNSQAPKCVQVVQKSKSDSTIVNNRSNPVNVNKQARVSHKVAVKQNDLLCEKKENSSMFKGAASSNQLANVSSLSESNSSRRASLKNLNIEDKKRVANLIKELAKTGEERELALERLQEERVSFEERLNVVQEEQTLLKQERESLRQRLEKSGKLLNKYESELKDFKEKEEQDKMLKKKFQARPQSTQTSPLIQRPSQDGESTRWGTRNVDGIQTHASTKSGRLQSMSDIQPHEMKKTVDTQVYDKTAGDGRMVSSNLQVPIYSNSLFDLKVSNVEQAFGQESQNDEYQRPGVTETDSLHELYLREYALQLRLQEQQIQIQRQQFELQQQLQLLQQTQGLARTQRVQDQPLHHQQLSNKGQQQQTREWPNQTNEKNSRDLGQERRLPAEDQQPHLQNWREQEHLSVSQNESILTEHSPTQQTNLLQPRSQERRDRHVEPNHRSDAIPRGQSDSLPRDRREHDHRTLVVENARREGGQYGDGRSRIPQEGDRSPSHSHYHHSGHRTEKNQTRDQHHATRHTSEHDSTHHTGRHRDMNRKKSSRIHEHQSKHVERVDLNNNEYFHPRSPTRKQKNRYDVNGNLMKDSYPHSANPKEAYSETDDQTDEERDYSSERLCHCGYYHARQQQLTSEYDQPLSKHDHCNHKSPRRIPQTKHRPTQIHHQPERANTYPKGILHDPNLQPEEPLVPHVYQPKLYHHHHDRHEEFSSEGHDHYYQDVQHAFYDHAQATTPAVVYQPPQEIRSKDRSREHRVSPQNVAPTHPAIPLSAHVGMTEDVHLPSERLRYTGPRVDQDNSKALLDDYIYSHQTVGQYIAKPSAGYDDGDKRIKQPIKRVISRKDHDGNLNPGYSLYQPNIPETTRKHHQTSPVHTQSGSSRSRTKGYPNSLVEIVEDLEVNSGSEYEHLDESRCSTEEGYDSDEEESTVLDNIFFLKR